MKRTITILLLIIFAAANIYSQNYNISFAASGASTTVGTVKVDNLTQNTSLTLNGNDILHLGPVGINETEYNTNNPIIYPNPMQGKAELSFNAEQDGDVQITINDITGKEVLHIGNNYPKGNHKFQLNGLKQGMYLVNIKSETYSYSLKLVSQNSNKNETAAIEYLGYENETSGKLKNTNTTVNMAYTNGDRLLFKGTSGNYSNIITDIPTSSKTITFNYTACTDYDNNNYATVQIGTQIWMAENLKTTHYKTGTAITYPGTNNTIWGNNTTGAYAWYNNDEVTYKNTYGALYNWYAVNTGNLCPTGWYVPTDAEWTTLTTYLGGESIAGGKLKATTLWNSPNIGATNSSGFKALPGGYRLYDGTYINVSYSSHWWCSAELNTEKVWYMYSNSGNIYSSDNNRAYGFSVRCLRDGSINSLNCGSSFNSGTLLAGTTANGVSSIINYTGGNGGIHNGQIVYSTGVNGLTATLAAGNFANGNGSLIYTITGTPAICGIASFALNIGGQNCILNRTITPSPVYDIDGNGYDTVHIGTQIWMAENLKTTHYKNGAAITYPGIDITAWQNDTIGGYAWYNNDSATYKNTYGALYNWYAVNTGNLCPTGWHVPSDAEWTTLTTYLGGEQVAGGKLKEVGLAHWNSPNTAATNETGFRALPGGYHGSSGYYNNIGYYVYWWSSTESNTPFVWCRYITSISGNVIRNDTNKSRGFSVRCLKD